MRAVKICGVAILWLFLSSVPALCAGAQNQAAAKEPDPMEVLQQMCNYLQSLQQFSFHSEVSYDEVYPGGKKLQFGLEMQTYVKRPDRIRVNAYGDVVNKRFFFDRRTITLYDRAKHVYATMQVPQNIGGALEKASKDYGLRVSLTELANPGLWKLASSKIHTALYVGLADVRGVACRHVAFDGENVQFQLWIAAGKKPLPLKIVFVEKKVEGEPQWTAYLSNWKTTQHLSNGLFTFNAPHGAQKIKFVPRRQPPAVGSGKGNKS